MSDGDNGNKRDRNAKIINQRVYRIITILFLGAALVILGKMVSNIATNPPQQPVTQNAQIQLDEQHTAEARFETESANIKLTDTAWAAYFATWVAMNTAWESTDQAFQTDEYATRMAIASQTITKTPVAVATITPSQTPTPTITPLPVEITQTYFYQLTKAAYINTDIAAATRTISAAYTLIASGGTLTPIPTSTALPNTGGGCCDAEQLVDMEIENLDQGRFLFNSPTEMVTGKKYRIELRIVRDSLVDSDLFYEATLSADLQGLGTPQVESLQVGNYMKAKLIGSDFEIVPLNEDEQIILGRSYTQWAWNVTPQRSGNLDLNLTISVKIMYAGEVGMKDHPVITKQIMVKVNPAYSLSHFIKDNWQWLMGSLILPLLAWIWKKINERKNEGNEERKPKKKKK